ncbi:MAG: acetylglutamate kinase [Clostridiales bacterium]|nr:acetylglutamate kinase [Clostridiales bacterium]
MFLSNMDKAAVLSQALPYIQKYSGETVVVKYGGAAMTSAGLRNAVIADLVLMTCVGIRVVLVHGGGKEIDANLQKMGIEPNFKDGIRVTDEETMDVVQMVLAGKTNKDLVREIENIGGKAIGLCGVDGGLIKAKKYEKSDIDYGSVGDITEIDVTLLNDLLGRGYIPVVSTVALGDADNPVYNINADIAALKIAVALGAQNLLFLTDVRGVLRDVHDEDTLLPEIKLNEVPALIEEGIISKGMIPKVDCCVKAVKGGVGHTVILDGRINHSLLIEMLTDEGVGTLFRE